MAAQREDPEQPNDRPDPGEAPETSRRTMAAEVRDPAATSVGAARAQQKHEREDADTD